MAAVRIYRLFSRIHLFNIVYLAYKTVLYLALGMQKQEAHISGSKQIIKLLCVQITIDDLDFNDTEVTIDGVSKIEESDSRDKLYFVYTNSHALQLCE